jgi:pyruvate formate lyase activating enzyme
LESGIIFDIKRLSVDDGPGFRTVVFLKGCPLNCIWCHSPESIKTKPELVIYESRCIGCSRCAEICPNGVIQVTSGGERRIQRDLCAACGLCTRSCYAGALEIKGHRIGADDLHRKIEKDRVFYEVSGGGVTFSGGEPLAQPKFLLDLLRRCKAGGIHTAVDTSGYASQKFVLSVIPYVDTFLFDLKCMDDAKHRELTGVSNSIILRNLRIIAQEGKDVIISVPVIPGYNTSLENVAQTMWLMKKLGLKTMRLLSANRFAGSKYKWLGRPYPLEGLEPPDEDWMNRAKALGSDHNIDVHIH